MAGNEWKLMDMARMAWNVWLKKNIIAENSWKFLDMAEKAYFGMEDGKVIVVSKS